MSCQDLRGKWKKGKSVSEVKIKLEGSQGKINIGKFGMELGQQK